ncbi:MAG: methyltransferase domain-containing protein [Armatimonadota bacterium]|nr:methyltransferase domain-containing protein [Armatimonadota bacterium]
MGCNPWELMTLDEARMYDSRKDCGPLRNQIAIKREIMWRQIRKRLPRNRSLPILDVGGGTGVWAVRLALEGYQVVLADISPGFLERARENAAEHGLSDRITFVRADMVDLGQWGDNEFQFVLAIGDPLSYCSDTNRALAELRRVTKLNGVLVADVENKYGGLDARRAGSWIDIRRILKDGIAYWPGSDMPVRQYSPGELRNTVEAAGWEIISMEPTDLLARLLQANDVDKLLSAKDGVISKSQMHSWVTIESALRKDAHLLGCGTEIQFIARNSG